MDATRLIAALHVGETCIEKIIEELKEITGAATNAQLFSLLETMTGVQRTSMHRWVSTKKTRRLPSRQTVMQFKLLLLMLRGEPENHTIDGVEVKRR